MHIATPISVPQTVSVVKSWYQQIKTSKRCGVDCVHACCWMLGLVCERLGIDLAARSVKRPSCYRDFSLYSSVLLTFNILTHFDF